MVSCFSLFIYLCNQYDFVIVLNFFKLRVRHCALGANIKNIQMDNYSSGRSMHAVNNLHDVLPMEWNTTHVHVIQSGFGFLIYSAWQGLQLTVDTLVCLFCFLVFFFFFFFFFFVVVFLFVCLFVFLFFFFFFFFFFVCLFVVFCCCCF